MRIPLLSFLLFIGVSSLSAQTDPSFEIRYSLPCNFAGSGTEKNQFTELPNGNMLLYRFEADSVFGTKHFIRIWCTDKMGSTRWERQYAIGEGDSVWLSASLKSVGTQAYLVYSHVDHSRKTSLRFIHFLAEDGAVLTSHKLDIPNEPQVRNIRSLINNQELVVAYDFLASDSSLSVGYGRIPFGNIHSATWFHTNELQKSTTLYLDGNDVRFVAVKDSTTIDFSLNQIGVFEALRFPPNYSPESVMVFNGSTYYIGNLYTPVSPFIAAILYKHHPTSGWAKKLNATGPSNYGSNAAAITNSGGKILILGYGTVPHPTSFLSVFEENGTPVKSEGFESFHSFNYNRGDLFKHSSGALFFSKLAGIWTGTQFATVLERIDTTNFTSCSSETYNPYPFADVSIQTDSTTVSFTAENYSFSTFFLIQHQDSFPLEIICHTHLSVNETNALNVTIYPNPFAERFTLEADSPADMTINCYDLLGKEVTVEKVVVDAQHVQLTPPFGFSGILFCRIQTTSGNTQTILVQSVK